MYSPQVLDHFQNPRNSGDIDDPDAVAEIENPACGDILRLSLKITAARIEKARFKAKGCVAAMACGSVLTELVTGKSLNQASRLNREDIAAALGGLPPASTHAAQLAVDAISEALKNVRS
jgi:nitrogen fixation protein NifU and related proteins